MDAGTIRLLEFLNKSKSVYRIPVYQRKYEWTEEQVNQYFYDIERIALSREIEGHFLGTVVFVRSTFAGMGTDYIIIDGQQRITTTFLLLKAIFDSLPADDYRKEEIYESYFINKFVEPAYERKLISVDDDREDYEALLVHDKSDKSTKIHMNYRRLMFLIQHSEASPEEIFDALGKIMIVYIELEQGKKDENPQTIFESLNSTGLSLTESDLIRNYLLMNETSSAQESLYKNYWLKIEQLLTNAKISDYIRDYLTMKTGVIPNKSKVYQSFKQYVVNEDISSESVLKDLYEYAENYQYLLNPAVENKEIQAHLQVILQLKSTVTYPYLLRLLHKYYSLKNISTNEVLHILQYITSYLMRRAIVNFPTNALNMVFSIIGKEVDKKAGEMSEEEAVIDYLMSRSGSALFPRNEKLHESILNDDLYNRNHKLVKLILGKVEQQIHKETVNLEDLTIEHIMPNTLTSVWGIELGRNAQLDHTLYKDVLGNLTLTNYNSELSNRSFADKKEYYKDSNVKITRDLQKYQYWNKESICERADFLYEKILEIWPLPYDFYKDNKQDVLKGDTFYAVFEMIKVTGKKPKVIQILNKNYKVNTWRSALFTYLEWLADENLEMYQNLPKQRSLQKLLSYDQSVLRKSEELAGIHVETNLSAQMIYNYISILAEFYEMEDDVAIQLAE